MMTSRFLVGAANLMEVPFNEMWSNRLGSVREGLERIRVCVGHIRCEKLMGYPNGDISLEVRENMEMKIWEFVA